MENTAYVPKEAEMYWYVDLDGVVFSRTNTECTVDARIFEFGNCFRTKKEAEAAAKKVRALLLSLHNNDENLQENIQDMVTNVCQAMDKGKENVAKATCTFGNLPKLTVEVFDRPDCPEWAKYAAVNANGKAVLFSDDPSCGDDRWRVTYYSTSTQAGILDDVMFDASDWQNSLIKRPVEENKLSEWCKVGAIGYNPEAGIYFSVDNIDEGGISLSYPYGSDNKCSLTFDYFKKCRPVQASLRPYTPEELEGLVGQVLKHSTGSYLVSAFETRWNQVKIESVWRDANELSTHWTHRDGRPCGKLEHLEGDEWVD